MHKFEDRQIGLTVRFGEPILPDARTECRLSDPLSTVANNLRASIPSDYSMHSFLFMAGGRTFPSGALVNAVVSSLQYPGPKNEIMLTCLLRAPPSEMSGWNSEPLPDGPTTPRVGSSGTGIVQEQSGAQPGYATASHNNPPFPGPHIIYTPRGLEGLRMTAGLSDDEVSRIRAFHRNLVSARYTPDQMPSEEAILQMEEHWLTGSAFPSSMRGDALNRSAELQTGSGPPVSEIVSGANPLPAASLDWNPSDHETVISTEEDDASRALDDTLLGVLIGFFWPVGAIVWGLREEGVWSRRRGWSVLAGVVVNLGFGLVRVMG